MQSTGHSSMHALSFRSTQGCAMTYVTSVPLLRGVPRRPPGPPGQPCRRHSPLTAHRQDGRSVPVGLPPSIAGILVVSATWGPAGTPRLSPTSHARCLGVRAVSFVRAYIVSITPADAGRRVSVRSRTDDAMLTDVVGDLLEWSHGVLRIRRRDGSIAEVAEDRLVAGKTVPASPARSAPLSAHTAIDQLELEEIASRGWLGLESRWLGRWLLRASEGFTGRGNSVLPLGDPGRARGGGLAGG